MNVSKLIQLEKDFLHVYPLGFESESIQEISKKHKIDKVSHFFNEACSKESIESGLDALEDIVKAVTRSSMVSVFEKVKFKDMIHNLSIDEKFTFLDALYENIYGDEEEGFNSLVLFLSKYKMAKWPIVSVFRAYLNLDFDVFMKPTTVKKIVTYLELDLVYNSKPTFSFYNKYREYFLEMKSYVNDKLKVHNPAFSGFLMMTIN